MTRMQADLLRLQLRNLFSIRDRCKDIRIALRQMRRLIDRLRR